VEDRVKGGHGLLEEIIDLPHLNLVTDFV